MHWKWACHCLAVLSQLKMCRKLILHAHLSWSLTLPRPLILRQCRLPWHCTGKQKQHLGEATASGGPHTPTSACSVKTPLFSLGWVPTPSSGNYPDRPRLAREWLSCSIQILGTVEVKQ